MTGNYKKGVQDLLARFVRDVSGTTAIEYGLIAGGIAMAIVAAVNGIGSTVNAFFVSAEKSF